jgi:hypothetical protein
MLTAEGPIHGLGRSNSHSSSSAANLQPTSPHFQRPSIAFVSPSNAETSRPALLTPTHATSQEFGRQTSRETDALAPSYLRPSSRRMTAAAQVPQTHRASCGELVGLVGSGCGHYTGPLSCPPGHAGHGIGFGESPNAVPMPSKEQQLSAISRLRQPLSVVVQKKSLIRCVSPCSYARFFNFSYSANGSCALYEHSQLFKLCLKMNTGQEMICTDAPLHRCHAGQNRPHNVYTIAKLTVISVMNSKWLLFNCPSESLLASRKRLLSRIAHNQFTLRQAGLLCFGALEAPADLMLVLTDSEKTMVRSFGVHSGCSQALGRFEPSSRFIVEHH